MEGALRLRHPLHTAWVQHYCVLDGLTLNYYASVREATAGESRGSMTVKSVLDHDAARASGRPTPAESSADSDAMRGDPNGARDFAHAHGFRIEDDAGIVYFARAQTARQKAAWLSARGYIAAARSAARKLAQGVISVAEHDMIVAAGYALVHVCCFERDF